MLSEITSFLSTDIRTATSIMICAIGLVFSSKAGIVNIGAEGMMLMGAFMGVMGSYLMGNVWFGVLFAMLSAMLIALVFAYFTVTLKADQTVVGTAINTLALGLTSTFSRIFFGMNAAPPKIDSFAPIALPLLSKIPALGPSLFTQPIPVYILYAIIPIAFFVLYKTNLGLQIRAVGENPRASDTVGVNVYRIRYGTILFSGLLSGFGGVFSSLGLLSFFTENMIAGRGFMAVAAVVFGKYNPLGVMGASLLFGAGEALKYRLQATNTGIPFQFLIMMPYLLTVLALCGFAGKPKEPKDLGNPYRAE
ncbi:MAG: ABC transporter permease [Bacillota bacterium]